MNIPVAARMRGGLLAAALFTASTAGSPAGDAVTLWMEKAPSLSGPWSRIDLKTAPLDADGNPRLPVETAHEFYRTQIRLGPSVQIGDPIPLSEVPPEMVTRAQNFINDRDESDPEGWPEDVELEPSLFPQYMVTGDGSVKPGYFEFKIVRKAVPATVRGFVTRPERELPRDCGYILLSATEEDFPIAEFAMEGPTPAERLARLAGTTRIRVVRYGPTFLVAESEDGKPVATQGALPFRPDPDILKLHGAEWTGDTDAGLDKSPEDLPRRKLEYYRDYSDFRADFASNPVYIQLRKNKMARAKLDWDIIHGKIPDTTTLSVGQTVTLLPALPAAPVPEYHFASDQGDLIRITLPAAGGIKVTGAAPGHGVLRVRQGTAEYVIAILVNAPAGLRNAGDVLATQSWYALSWQEQPRYFQLSDDNWCDLVGCGPTAWAILFSWFDRNQGIEQAFRGEGSGLPPFTLSTAADKAKVKPAYNELHELCDVICDLFSDQGATWPSDMTEGFKDYTKQADQLGQIKRSWNINSDMGTWPDAGALRSRDAIKKGYPAVTGLGWLWHYVVAYGYKYKTIDLGNGKSVDKRYL
ncbi:MAG TPA: hypothetical protein VHM91_14045, partial [Verrucomicrobiales bacterium]|nr:hypothetical protein [Verrucomicrobiales bacterium]